jgi:hypothetical protein
MMVPGIVSECVAEGENVMLSGRDELPKDRRFTAALSAQHKEPFVGL